MTPEMKELFDNFDKKMVEWKDEKCDNSNQVISGSNYANAGKTCNIYIYIYNYLFSFLFFFNLFIYFQY